MVLVKVNDNIILVGTAHISPKSVEEVREAIIEFKPDIVAVELCERRYKGLTEKDKWENTEVTELLKSNNAYYFLAQLFLSALQRELGKEYGVQPGAEMLAAIEEAEKQGIPVTLVDRDIAITLKRAWKKMGFREKTRFTWEFLKTLLGLEEVEEIDLDKLMDQDIISAMMEELKEIAPSATEVLIDERDTYIAKKILDASRKGRVLAVVGAGHIKGIREHLEKPDIDLKELEEIPKKKISWIKTIGYIIPVLFAFLIGYALFTKGATLAGTMFLYWFLINGVCSAAGAAIAGGHPLSILTAFFAAPITSLNPAIAAGWVAGYVEAKIRTPVVKDFQELRTLESFKDFWHNRVVRLLLVVALANVGSMIGTIIALPYITSLLGLT
ncbi:MAG TPA: TraB/GumN family protein [Thermoplasmatales archaeon]|nr:TraB/GumN family protein [Thermoplasmatales archaeon]